MNDIVQTLEQDGEALLTWIETDVKAVAAKVGAEVLSDLRGFLDSELGLLVEAGVDIATGIPVDVLLTKVLNAAGAAGKVELTKLPDEILNAAVSVFVAGKTVAPATT